MNMISSICPKLATLIIALFAFTFSYGQGWERVYENNPNPPLPLGYSFATASNVFQLDDGTFQVITETDGVGMLRLLNDQGYQITSDSIPVSYVIKTSDDNFVYVYRTSSTSPPEENVVVSKYNPQGNTLWSYTFDNINWSAFYIDIIQDASENYVISAGSSGAAGAYVLKLNENGDELWKTYTNLDNFPYQYHLVELGDGGYLVGSSSLTNTVTFNTYLTKLDNNGNILWQIQPPDNAHSHIQSIVTLSDGFITFGMGLNDQNFAAYTGVLVKYDLDGNFQWTTEIDVADFQFPVKLIQTADGGFAALMGGQNDNGINESQIFLVKLDANGYQQWFQDYGLLHYDSANDILQTADDGFIMCGAKSDGGEETDIYIIKTDENGVSVSNIINGFVKYDTNENCDIDNDEDPLDGWIVSAVGDQVTYYAVADENGYYEIEVDQGTFEVRTALPSPYWNSCVDSTVVQFNTTYDTATVLIPIQTVEQCPLMDVQMHGLDIRFCEENTIHINCENIGTALAEEVTVDLTFDDFFEFVSASNNVTVIDQVDNTFTFEIGDLDYFETIDFSVTLQHDCDTTDMSIIGQAFCVDAQIFPDSTCLPISPFWSGAELDLLATCEDNEVQMIIKNIGDGNMSSALDFTIVEDDVIMSVEPFGPLTSGETFIINRPANGNFQRIETPQEPFHPIGNIPVAFVEGCGENGIGEISVGYINQYALGDDSPFEDVLCLELVAAYDPNEKVGLPTGYQAEHFIEKNTTISYTLHFQNIGSAEANRVVVTDVLSEFLDPTTIQLGASSHPFTFKIYGADLIEFTFDNIMLPDSASNPAGSQGFVQFKIDQQNDLPMGTQIFNDASIYFDSNAAIRTNKTMHTIGENFISVSIDEVLIPNMEIKVYPNPFNTTATFEILTDNNYGKAEMIFELHDIMGRKLISRNFNDGTFILNRGDLASGTYFYTILNQSGLINSGKVVVQKN